MKRLAVFLIVTFGLTWGLLIPAGIALGTFEAGETSAPAMIALIAVSMFFPLVGALAANAACGPEGRIDLGFKPFIRKNLRHYLVAWFLPAALVVLGCSLFFGLNPQWFDPTLSAYAALMQVEPLPAEQAPAMLGVVAVFALLLAPFINAIPAVGEEAGWRGMLYPTLAGLLPERSAVLASGAIWGLWHAPVIAMGHNYGMGYAGFPLAGIAVMILMCTAFGCWLSYLRMRTGSVWPCALAHGSFNAVANIGVVFCAAGPTLFGPSPLGLVAGIPLLVVGALFLLRFPPSR